MVFKTFHLFLDKHNLVKTASPFQFLEKIVNVLTNGANLVYSPVFKHIQEPVFFDKNL